MVVENVCGPCWRKLLETAEFTSRRRTLPSVYGDGGPVVAVTAGVVVAVRLVVVVATILVVVVPPDLVVVVASSPVLTPWVRLAVRVSSRPVVGVARTARWTSLRRRETVDRRRSPWGIVTRETVDRISWRRSPLGIVTRRRPGKVTRHARHFCLTVVIGYHSTHQDQ